jgi:hypothetical protein
VIAGQQVGSVVEDDADRGYSAQHLQVVDHVKAPTVRATNTRRAALQLEFK